MARKAKPARKLAAPRGYSARFAYDPQAFCAYIQAKTDYMPTLISKTRNGLPYTQVVHVKTVNGVRFDQTDDARRLLRWSGGVSLSRQAAERFLARYRLTLEQFEAWGKAQHLKVVLWDRRTETKPRRST